jgi:hypothetical protein
MAAPVTAKSKKYWINLLRDSLRGKRKTAGHDWVVINRQQTAPNTELAEFTDGQPATQEKLRRLRDEFVGRPLSHFMHAACIVHIRRAERLHASRALFLSMWAENGRFLSETLSSRWLISALDTFVDIGEPATAARSMAVVAMFNTLRFAESERYLTGAGIDVAELPVGQAFLWDDVEVYRLQRGDALWNTLVRLRRTLAADPPLIDIFEALWRMALKGDTLFKRLVDVNQKDVAWL